VVVNGLKRRRAGQVRAQPPGAVGEIVAAGGEAVADTSDVVAGRRRRSSAAVDGSGRLDV
jgi:hypothetical protein